MNCIDVRKYWCRKYEEKFGVPYASNKIPVELSFFKKIITEYNEYVLLEAIDELFNNVEQKNANILYFANPNKFHFNTGFLISIRRILKYSRNLHLFPDELKQKVKDLIKEYKFCSHELSSDYDFIRRQKIEQELQELTNDYFKG